MPRKQKLPAEDGAIVSKLPSLLPEIFFGRHNCTLNSIPHSKTNDERYSVLRFNYDLNN